jgi:hypothetical protein
VDYIEVFFRDNWVDESNIPTLNLKRKRSIVAEKAPKGPSKFSKGHAIIINLRSKI